MYNTLDVGTIRALLPYQSWIHSRNSSLIPALKRNGLSRDLSKEPGTSWMPYHMFVQVFDDLKEQTDIVLNPLELSDEDVSQVFDMDFSTLGSNNKDGLMPHLLKILTASAKRLAPSIAIWFDIKAGALILRFSIVTKGQVSDFRTLSVFRSLMVVVKAVLGSQWSPPYVDLDLDMASSVSLGNKSYRINSVQGRNAIPLELVVPASDMRCYLDQMINSPARTTTKIRSVIQMLGLEFANVQIVSDVFGVSRRTLHRALREEGTTFKQLVLDIKMQQAKVLLVQGNHKEDISNSLGYNNTSNFLRLIRVIIVCHQVHSFRSLVI